jgi:titin
VRSNAIQGNLIGTDVSGQLDLGNTLSGVRVESSANVIGGALAAARNVISGNGENGVYLSLAGASNNVIQGNFIGTAVTGTTGVANGSSGIGITGASANTIGGVGTGNVISGNSNMAIYLQNGASGNVFQGNFIGTDVTGTSGLANGSALPVADIAGGIDISASPSNIIGGTLPGAGNLISGNWRDAILIQDAGATGNIIQGNTIGTQIDDMSPLGNHWHGVEIGSTGGGAGTLIGGSQTGAANRIAFAVDSGWDGVRIRSASGNTGILIRGNSFFGNGGASPNGLAIDLGTDGVTPNDNCDNDSGANLLQNYPTLLSASGGGQTTTIQGSLNGVKNTAFLLQFYSSPTCDASGFGEGQTYLGDATVTTDDSCNASFTVVLTNVASPGSVIAATATDPANNTSEFSACVTVAPSSTPPSLSITWSADSITLSWPAASPGFSAQQATNLTPPVVWAPVPDSPILIGDQYVLTTTPGSENVFYRLILQ